MNTAFYTAVEEYFYSFGATFVILIVLAAAIYLVYRKGNKSEPPDSEAKSLPKWLEDAEHMATENHVHERPMSFGYALKSAIGVIAIALAVAVLIYIWMIGIRAYDGAVEQKYSSKGSRLQISVYYIDVQNETYPIGEGLYKKIKKGDRVRRPFGAPWTYVNEKPVIYTFALTLFGVLSGFLAMAAGVINIMIWLSYGDHRFRRKAT